MAALPNAGALGLAVTLILLLLGGTSPAASRTPWTTSRVFGSPNPPAPYRIEPAYPNLKFASPVDAAMMPGSDRMFVLEQRGKLYSFIARPEVAETNLVFDFKQHHQPFDSSYAIAFHPRFPENRFIYVCYVEPANRAEGSFVSRFTVNATEPPTIDPASERVIIRWLSGGHNGCTLAFGNDGFLYFSTGDATHPDPPDLPHKTGQDISDLLSSVLRIDVDRTEGTNNYAIPRDNPFVKTPGARPEVYAFGFRNPWRMSFDRATGDLWVGDVGWEQWEMVYRVKPGGNYGWSITEGPNTRVRTDVKPGPGPILPPMASIPHSDGASITGGFVYHGSKLPKLRGAYVYGDWETGKFWALRHKGDDLVANDELCDTALKPSSFAIDRDGELLIVDYNGGFYSLVPNTAPPANLAFPRRLSETGLFTDIATLAPAPGVVSYRINAPAWNDGATAERVLGIPGEDAIATAGGRQTIAGRMWYFPSNTVFARTLTLELERGNPASRRRIETQLFHFDGQAWSAYTFRWNTAQRDADLVPAEGANDMFNVKDAGAPGGRREIPWRFVSRAECFRCHNAWAGETLSFNWLQLNTPGEQPEFKRLEDLGVLQVKNPPKAIPRLANPYDSSHALAERARSWIHVNCGTCHRNGAGGDVPAWFNYEVAVDKARIYDALPVRGSFGMAGARVIASSDPYRSALLYRISTEGAGRMPHIGSRIADEAGIRVVRDWIRSLPPKGEDDAEVTAARKMAAENAELLARCRTDASAVSKLLSNTSGALALLCEATEPDVTTDFRQRVVKAATAQTNSLVRELFERLLPPDQRRHTLGSDFNPQVILSLKGDVRRGRVIFHQEGGSQCARCHRVNNEGPDFGPDLTGIAAKYSRAQVLEHILQPSKAIAPEHRTFNVTLGDDTELTGFILQRTASELVLRDETLKEHRLKLANIKESRESALSAMPEGLLAPLTAQEAADLLEFLLSTKPRTPTSKRANE
ncbi:MAG: PQQ-dependent sugar dehydrogenase [Verrucomicrobiota bacterium]